MNATEINKQQIARREAKNRDTTSDESSLSGMSGSPNRACDRCKGHGGHMYFAKTGAEVYTCPKCGGSGILKNN